MKESLFNTPFKNSRRNFALDTQREMEHKAVLRGFRPRSTIDSVLPRMSLVDKLMEIEEMDFFHPSGSFTEDTGNSDPAKDNLTWKTTEKDLRFVIPTARMMLRTKRISPSSPESTPFNVYEETPTPLPLASLDVNTKEAGEYLIRRYLIENNMMGMSKEDARDVNSISAPKELLTKLKTGKSNTIKRMACRAPVATSTPVKKEKKRKEAVKKQTKVIDCLSFRMNTCQAFMRPDCTKLETNKATGVKNALIHLLSSNPGTEKQTMEEKLTERWKTVVLCTSTSFKHLFTFLILQQVP